MKTKLYLFTVLILVSFIVSCKKDDSLPDKQAKSLCEQIEELENDGEFTSKLTILYNNSIKYNYEAGFLMYANNKDGYSYEIVTGELNNPSLRLTLTKEIDGVLHSHYNGLNSIFSIGDIYALNEIIKGQFIRNPKTFNFGVVSSKGVSYLIKFTDFKKATAFLGTNFMNTANMSEIEKQYKAAINRNLINNNAVTASELAFLEIFGANGMILLKADIEELKWRVIDLNTNYELVNVLCSEF